MTKSAEDGGVAKYMLAFAAKEELQQVALSSSPKGETATALSLSCIQHHILNKNLSCR